MEELQSVVLVILTVVYAVVCLIIYHKLFHVIYFDLGNGCLKEIIGASLAGLLLAALTVLFWYISIPIIILLLIALFKKK